MDEARAPAARDACTKIMLRETLKAAPIQVPLTPPAAARAGANLVGQALMVLRPLTHPRRGAACAVAVEVAALLEECVLKLRPLHAGLPPREQVVQKVAPVSPKTKKGRHDVHYVGPNWSPERVGELKRKLEEDVVMPHGECTEYLLDTVCADRQWTIARIYLAGLYAAAEADGTIIFDGNEYTRQQLKKVIPKMREFQAKRRNAAVKTTGHLFAREGVKTAKSMLKYTKWKASCALKDRSKSRCCCACSLRY